MREREVGEGYSRKPVAMGVQGCTGCKKEIVSDPFNLTRAHLPLSEHLHTSHIHTYLIETIDAIHPFHMHYERIIPFTTHI